MKRTKMTFLRRAYGDAARITKKVLDGNLAAVGLSAFSLEILILILYYILNIKSNAPLYLSLVLSVTGIAAMVFHLKRTVK